MSRDVVFSIEVPLATYEAHEEGECPVGCVLCAHEDLLMQQAFREVSSDDAELLDL